MRLDVKLVELGLFKTRSKAQDAIKSGLIHVNGKKVTKTGYMVSPSDFIEIVGEVMPYVSRGGKKLEKAIKVFSIDMNDKKVLDIGSSTGGFSDCALKHGARSIVAVDVGSDQFDPELKKNKRITLFEKTDFRNMDNSLIDNVDIIVMDVSFISVTQLIEKISSIKSNPDIMCLIKPQFECGRDIAFKYKGIIKDLEVHRDVINNVVAKFNEYGYYLVNIDVSPIRGGDGNVEYISYFKYNSNNKDNYLDIVSKA